MKKLSINQYFVATILIVIAASSIYIIVALISFNSFDPSWSQTAWIEPTRNLCGDIGAWIADVLLFIFGIIAYIIPLGILFMCWVCYLWILNPKGRINYLDLSLRLIGALFMLLSSCGLAALYVNDIYHFSSGGLIGWLIANVRLLKVYSITVTSLLLFSWVAGLSLLTNSSWIMIAEKIYGATLDLATRITNLSKCKACSFRYNNCHESCRFEITVQELVILDEHALLLSRSKDFVEAFEVAVDPSVRHNASVLRLAKNRDLLQRNHMDHLGKIAHRRSCQF